ncbi:MAG: transposase, partial [Anaerolineaceae bacterium]
MLNFPQRKPNRLTQYDYSQTGVYFITICTKNRNPIFWKDVRLFRNHPEMIPFSESGRIVEQTILNIANIYPHVVLETCCIMPDHLHLLLQIQSAQDGRTMCAPTLSRIVKHLKEAVTKQIGQSIWQ